MIVVLDHFANEDKQTHDENEHREHWHVIPYVRHLCRPCRGIKTDDEVDCHAEDDTAAENEDDHIHH